MLEALSSLFSLRWTNTQLFHPLPDNVTRTYVSTALKPRDQLELLVSDPPPNPTAPPILFLHGGFGHASVWLPFITHLASTTQCFALSCRNHGASYTVSYLRMVYFTTVADLANDIIAAITHIQSTTGHLPVLVAHSSAGGLSQYILSRKLATTPALVLLDAVPHFGNLGVYANWAKHDPVFALRMLVHAQHVISPLSSVALVRGAFFGSGDSRRKELSDMEVAEFERWMPRYESLMWPMQLFGSFWGWLRGRPRWLSVRDILGGIRGDERALEGKRGVERVCVMVGEKDVLMDVGMCSRVATEFREEIRSMRADKKMDGGQDVDREVHEEDEEKIVEREGGVRFVVIKGAGHHTQNDVQWEIAAEELRRFVVQV